MRALYAPGSLVERRVLPGNVCQVVPEAPENIVPTLEVCLHGALQGDGTIEWIRWGWLLFACDLLSAIILHLAASGGVSVPSLAGLLLTHSAWLPRAASSSPLQGQDRVTHGRARVDNLNGIRWWTRKKWRVVAAG